MARELIQYVKKTDDITGEVLDDLTGETIELGIDGRLHLLDLSDVNAKELRDFLSPYLDAAHDTRKIGLVEPKKPKAGEKPPRARPGEDGPASQTMRDREARTRIREWARVNGYEVADNGIIHFEIVLAFHKAHPRTYIPETTLTYAQSSAANQGDE